METLAFEEQNDTFSIVGGGKMEKQALTQVGFIYGDEDLREFLYNDILFFRK